MKTKSGDWMVAGSVILCSIVLFIALVMGLSGRTFVPDSQAVRVRFHDITGIKVSSLVKFAGAPAGTVSSVRMLSAAERAKDPANLVEITLHLHPEVPKLNQATTVSIAADTLLSDKFVLISEGDPSQPALAADAILQGISPTTFDKLVRNADDAIEGLRRTLAGGGGDGTRDLLGRAEKVLGETEALLASLKPAVEDVRLAAADARSILADNKEKIGSTIGQLGSAATNLDSLARRGEALIRTNERPIGKTLADFQITAENLKVTSTYSKFLLRDLAERPSRLIWGGGRPPALPSEQEILKARQPLGDR